MTADALSVFDNTDLSPDRAAHITSEMLKSADDGELFAEIRETEAFTRDDGRLRHANYDISAGFGFRFVAGEQIGYAHSTRVTEEALKHAAESARAASGGYSGVADLSPPRTNHRRYSDINPLTRQSQEEKIHFLEEADAYIRAKNPAVKQVSVSILAALQKVAIFRADGSRYYDNRPLVRMGFNVTVEKNGRRETGFFGTGGRVAYDDFLQSEKWQAGADEALRQAMVNLEAIPAPAGEIEVVLGPGWPGVLLHEAVGHGLEGDFNRKKTSAFAGLLGEKVAADGVTVVDDGTIYDRRGSLTIDDEGTPTERTVLIEDGVLKGYIQDRQNARLMGMKPTGNGRRESFSHTPMPRMTNTFMTGGSHDPEEIIASVKNGIYAVNFGGGQVDITSGKFVFECTEAYRVIDGKIGAPVKGATLIGSGPEALKYITMIGNDMKLDEGIGTCGKAGQSVPCGVGQPSMKLSRMTVGGTDTG